MRKRVLVTINIGMYNLKKLLHRGNFIGCLIKYDGKITNNYFK